MVSKIIRNLKNKEGVLRKILLILMALLFCGCAGSMRQEILVVPDSKKSNVKSFFVSQNLSDNRGINNMIERSISRQGYEIKSSEKVADVIVTYEIAHLDYGILYIIFRDSKDRFPMVIGNEIRNGSQTLPLLELMVQEVVDAMMIKQKQGY